MKFSSLESFLLTNAPPTTAMSNFYLIVKRRASCALLALGFPSLLSAGEPGKLTREIWNNLPGTNLSAFTSSPRYGQPAESVTTFDGAAVPQNIGDSFASRVRGYLTAPVTGDYTFWIASDDESELRLSPTDSKFGRAKIASITGWVQLSIGMPSQEMRKGQQRKRKGQS